MVNVDAKDKKILQALDRNGRLSIAEISKKTNIQRDSVIYRIKRMKKNGVIRFFHTVVSPSALGYEIYSFVHFFLHNINPQRENEFITYLRNHKNVVYLAKTTGKYDYKVSIAAKSLTEFDAILTGIRINFSDIVKDYETASIIQEIKYDYMVDLI